MKIFFLFILSTLCISSFAQIPEGYYNQTENLEGYVLKTKLHEIISAGHIDKGYSWTFFNANDIDNYYENDGTILDIYSENPSGMDPYNFTVSDDQCGSYDIEGDCYNREHSFPQGWFGKASPMKSDVHHLFATDGKINGIRSNYPYGNVGSASKTSKNGSMLGSAASDLGYTGTVFEPIDEFKGDLARAQFYMATRYEDKVTGWSSVILDGTSDKVFEQWVIDLFIQWHNDDPVSQKEIDRNNAAYNFQGNRNPFIDHPEFVECIWDDACNNDGDPDPEISACDYYFPSSDDNPTWYEVNFTSSNISDFESHNYNIYRLISDTTINKTLYSKLVGLSSPNQYIGMAEYVGAIRTDTCGKTYVILKDQQEHLLYDFSLDVGDTVHTNFMKDEDIYYYLVKSIDSVNIENLGYRKRMVVQWGLQQVTWIEGIGSEYGLLWPMLDQNEFGRMLTCHYQQNQLAYKGWDNDCYYEPDNTTTEELNLNNCIDIYPQPANEYFLIKINKELNAHIKIYDQVGRVFQQYKNVENTLRVSTENWSSGIYFLKLTDSSNGFTFTKSVVID